MCECFRFEQWLILDQTVKVLGKSACPQLYLFRSQKVHPLLELGEQRYDVRGRESLKPSRIRSLQGEAVRLDLVENSRNALVDTPFGSCECKPADGDYRQ